MRTARLAMSEPSSDAVDVDAVINKMTEEELIDFMGPQFWISLVHRHLEDEDWRPDVRREVREHLLDV